jgi:hypothetical protein
VTFWKEELSAFRIFGARESKEGLMSLQNAHPGTLPQGSNGWLRRAWKVFVLLTRTAPPTGTPAPVEPSLAPRRQVVGVKKSAVCKDARGQLRTIDFFLPADLLTELARPIDIKFLDGDEPVTADELGKAIRSNFPTGGASPHAGESRRPNQSYRRPADGP